ncbi:hypothetical protein [Pelagicoccus enzymogenes]|uniref:hypothetical protein n=1 Tax=Pelagicoccus enzymogenes TaxID=2773457 RepID=UPI0017827939|nr:hypothetical protein [Pelagicoccus enzymogenes]
MQNCPHCNEPGLSVSRKLTLGPANAANCENCGKKIGVPSSAIWYYLPFFIVAFASWPMDSIVIKGVAWPLAFIGICYVQLKLPLVKR